MEKSNIIIIIMFIFVILILSLILLNFNLSKKKSIIYEPPPKKEYLSEEVLERLDTIYLPSKTRQDLSYASMNEAKLILAEYFNGQNNDNFIIKESERGGVGLFAAKNIPAFTVVGLYPGYPVTGSTTEGAPIPKYILVRFNSADVNYKIYPEI